MSDPTVDDAPLKRQLLELDILLRRKQNFWETWRGILLVVATTAAVAGVLGWKIGSTPQSLNVNFGQPLSVQLLPPKTGG